MGRKEVLRLTIEEAKKELKSYRLDCMSSIDEMEEILRLEAKAEKTTSSYEMHYQKEGAAGSTMESYAILAMDGIKKLDKHLKEEEKRLQNVREAVSRLPNPYRKVLTECYYNHNTINNVAKIIDDDYRNTQKKHKEALKRYAEIRSRAEI